MNDSRHRVFDSSGVAVRPSATERFFTRITARQLLNAFVGTLVCLCAFAAAMNFLTTDDQALRSMHAWGSAILGFTCFLMAVLLAAKDPLSLWTPMPWFLFACTVYFGLGPELYHWGTLTSVDAADGFWPVETRDLVRTHLLSCVGILFVMIGAGIAYRAFSMMSRPAEGSGAFMRLSSRQTAAVTIALLCVGLPVKYALYLPHVFGALSYEPPGSLLLLRNAIPVAIAFMVVLAARHTRLWLVPLVLIFSAELLVSVLEFSKAAALSILLALFLGIYLVLPKLRVLLPTCVALAAIYVVLVPLTSFGRAEISVGNLSFYEASLDERLEILQSFIGGERSQALTEVPQDWWLRVNYANAQTFAMTEYESGRPVHAWQLAGVAFIPRFLWPDKPAVSSVANYFNYLVTGQPASASAPGIFAEGYYSGGWLGAVLMSLCVGLVLGGFSWYGRRRIARGELLFLPVVLFAIQMGLRIDGWFVIDYVGTLGLAVCAHMVLRMIYSLLGTASPLPDSESGRVSLNPRQSGTTR